MVDFRYHLVTIIAIFLALAVGVVVGTTALNGPVLDGLRSSNSGLISDKRALESDVRALQGDVDTADQFTRALYGDLLAGELTDERVLLVTAPDADERIAEQLTTAIEAAGGSVTGELALQAELLDPTQSQLVDDLVASVVPAGVELPEGSAVNRAAVELAAALLVPPRGDAINRTAAQEVVSAFEEAGLVQMDEAGDQLEPATLAVLIAAPASQEPDDEAADRDTRVVLDGLLAVASVLDAGSSGAVLAGPSTSVLQGGLLRALRADGDRDAEISSVDNAERAVGQVAVVLALAEQLEGRAGRYGGGQGATAPVPTASASPSRGPASG